MSRNAGKACGTHVRKGFERHVGWRVGTTRSGLTADDSLLHVGNFAVHERHFHVFVEVNLLAGEFDNLLRLAQSVRDLVGSHAHFHGLRIGLLLLVLTTAISAASRLLPLIPALLLLVAALLIIIAAFVVARSEELRTVIDKFALQVNLSRFVSRGP